MADINKSDIKLMASQRLSDVDQGGGQMTAVEIVDGAVNNLFPDISRLDRTYGRVSLRKAFMAVKTSGQETYYGSHAAISRQAADPLVNVVFFSNEDWFDTRGDASSRMESYLVRGPLYYGALYGNHYLGTKLISIHTDVRTLDPEIGDVLCLVGDDGLSSEFSQYVRITEVSSVITTFVGGDNVEYDKKILTLGIGDALEYTFTGEAIFRSSNYVDLTTNICTTVVADAATYYGVSGIDADITSGDLSVEVSELYQSIVPSARSQNAILDFGVGGIRSSVLPILDAGVEVLGSCSMTSNATVYLGTAIEMGSFYFKNGAGTTQIHDDSKGNILADVQNDEIVGSIDYLTGTLNFASTTSIGNISGKFLYTPAVSVESPLYTGSIEVTSNNRGFVYVYNCEPDPMEGTLLINYVAGNRWYTLYDKGGGEIGGATTGIGTGVVNYATGSLSLTLGAMPDIGSNIYLYWGIELGKTDLSKETINYKIEHTVTIPDGESITKGTVSVTWIFETIEYTVTDNGKGRFFQLSDESGTNYENCLWGDINYDTGVIRFTPSMNIVNETSFTYNFLTGPKEVHSETPYTTNTTFTTTLVATGSILPGSVTGNYFVVSSDNDSVYLEDRVEYEKILTRTPIFFKDDGIGGVLGKINNAGDWISIGTIDYVTKEITVDALFTASQKWKYYKNTLTIPPVF